MAILNIYFLPVRWRMFIFTKLAEFSCPVERFLDASVESSVARSNWKHIYLDRMSKSDQLLRSSLHLLFIIRK